MREYQKIRQSRSLRRRLTPAERALWSRLRDHRMNGRHFRRQEPIGRFIADFCCEELKLIVEVDGDVHVLYPKRDAERQTILENMGYKVLRFTNQDVVENLRGVLEVLFEMTRQDFEMIPPEASLDLFGDRSPTRFSPHPSPPPSPGEGNLGPTL